MRTGLLVGAGLLLMAPGGCGGRAEPRSPAIPDLPAAWVAPARLGDPAPGWVAALGDPALPALVDEALAANPDLRAALARLDAARAQARIAGAALAPGVDLRAGADRARVAPNIPGLPGLSGIQETWTAGLAISWEIDLWGRVRAGRRAAVADAEAVAADLLAARLSLSARVARAWFAARADGEARRTALALVENLRGGVGFAEERYRSGLAEAEDVRELRAALGQAVDAAAVADERGGASLRALEVLLGRYPAGALAVPAGLATLPGPVPAGVPAGVIARRPDLRAAERRLAAAGARGDAARGALYPRLSLTASGGYSSPALSDLLAGDVQVWSFAANLVQPVFQGGRLRAELRRQRAGEDEADAAFAGAVLRALAEVEDALAIDAGLERREQALAGIHAEAAALERLAGERWRAGTGDALAVLAARRGALEAEASLTAVRARRLATRVDLHLALGGPPLAPAPEHAPPAPAAPRPAASQPAILQEDQP